MFGDGSVELIATSGHTPGRQSLLVKLEKTGTVLLTGDAVHFQDNWDHRRVPSFKHRQGPDDRVHATHRRHPGQGTGDALINHDKPSSEARRHAPEFYE